MPDPLIKVVAEIASTNSALLARLAEGEAPREGHWLVADRQTAGRGRAGRVWTGGYGNFMGSTAVALRDGEMLPQTLAPGYLAPNAPPLEGFTSQTPAMGMPARVAVSAWTLPIAPAPMMPSFMVMGAER